MRRTVLFTAILAALVSIAPRLASAQGPERGAVDKGVAFLKSKVSSMMPGEAALASLAMIKAEVPASDPGLQGAMSRFAVTFAGTSYQPDRKMGPEIYEASCVVLALVNIDPIAYKPQIEAACQYIMTRQKANGSWDYDNRNQGDTSISQYAILACWEAENAGIIVRPELWDNAASWFVSVQSGVGSWNYHRDESASNPETISMTAAGVGSLMICQQQLARHRKGQDLINPLMTPISVDGTPFESRYKVKTPAASINQAVTRGSAWLSSHFVIEASGIIGQSPYYGLYGIERLSALGEKGKATLGGIDWYNRGLQFVLQTQKPSGNWDSQHGDVPNTCWAILFSVKATEKSLKKIAIRRLQRGNLQGGRELPSDMSNLEVAGGRVVVRPMGGAIEGMLAVLEDPNNLGNADAALAGIVAQYQTDGPKALRPLKDRFRKLLRDPDPGIRRVAAWGLGRTLELDVAPLLIKALLDPEDDVTYEARLGLQVLARKLDGYGPEKNATPEAKLEAARRWRDWFNSVKPSDLDAPDDLPVAAGKAPAGDAAPKAPAGQ